MPAAGAPRAKPRWNKPVDALKKEAILAAAREEFEAQGLDQASMRAIAARAGCTTGAIYPLFASKEHIYAALLEQSLAALHRHVTAAHAQAGARPHEAAARAFLDYYLERPYEVNLGLYTFKGIKPLGVGKESDRMLNASLAATVRLFSPRPQEPGTVPDLAAMGVFTQLIGLLVLHLSGRLRPVRTTPAALLDRFFDNERAAAPDATPGAARPHRETPP